MYAIPRGRGTAKPTPRTSVGGQGYTDDQAAIRTEAAGKMAALNDPNSEFQKSYADREKALKEQYAGVRSSFGAQKQALGQDYERQLARQQAIGGMAGGGASMKMASKNQQQLGQTYGSLEAGLSGEEAAARENLMGQKSAEQLAREEAIRSGEQFQQTLKFQEGSFADQMGYSWAEFDENQKTNLMNVLALMKDAGFLDSNLDELTNFYESGLNQLYPNAPKPTQKKSGMYMYA